MRFILKLSLLIYILLGTAIFAQTETQIKQKLQQEGIKTKSDVTQELQKRNMTEDDARRMAKQYGMDYDSFIQKYIMQGKDSAVQTSEKGIQNLVEKQAEQKATLEEKPEITKELEKPLVVAPVPV